ARCRCFSALRTAPRRCFKFHWKFERSGVGNSLQERRIWAWPILEEPPKRQPGFEQGCELSRKNRPAEIVSLRLITLAGLKECQFFVRLDALGNNPEAETCAHPYNRSHNRCLGRGNRDLTDERLIDLQRINRELPEIAQTGIPCAKVIDGHLHAARSQCLKDCCGRLGARHQNALGEFELK